jgi:hypothetical protein
MGEATRAAISRSYEVDRGDDWSESDARERGEGGGEGGAGRGVLSGLSASLLKYNQI